MVIKQEGPGDPGGPRSPPAPPPPPSDNAKIKHIFVLVMENRSYDHFLGYSEYTGTDTQTGAMTRAEGLGGGYYNDYKAQTTEAAISVAGTGTITSSVPGEPITSKLRSINDPPPHFPPEPPPPPAPPPPPNQGTLRYPTTDTAGDTTYKQGDVKHQFSNIMAQLCGAGQEVHAKLNGAKYPPVLEAHKTGFAYDYGQNVDSGNPGEPMRCFNIFNLPVLNALAREFVLCDHWFSSLPGPTEPNRMFVHAATSGGWDDSPTGGQYFDIFFKKKVVGEGFGDNGRDYGIGFEDGTIFDRLRLANKKFRIYTGDSYPQVGLLQGISILSDIDDFGDFAQDLKDPGYDADYTFIEPRYDQISTSINQWLGSHLDVGSALSVTNNSQHPANSVALGEQLIKSVYEAVRNSPLWNESMLIITWDEHGGFFDHVKPPPAQPIPTSTAPNGIQGNVNGFMFDQYGPRVPAVVISPWCPQNMIEHRQLEHSVIPATIEQVFGLVSMTVRDYGFAGVGLQKLATLATPRTVSVTIPDPINAATIAAIQPKGPAPTIPIDPVVVSSGPITGVGPARGNQGVQASAPEPLAKAAVASPPTVSALGTPFQPTLVASAPGTPVGATPVSSAPAAPIELSPAALAQAAKVPLDLSDPWLASALAAAVKAHLTVAPADAANIQARVTGLKTVADLVQYHNDMAPIVSNARVLARQQRVAARKQPVP
jgi:phospholipase C